MAVPVFQPPPTHAEVIVHDPRDRWIFNPVWSKWFLDLTQVLNNSGGGSGTIVHNSTSGLQGGGTGEYYHLTAAEHTFVAAVAPGSTSAKFLRGDATWSDTLTEDFTAQGNVTLGDAAGDTLTVNAGVWTFGSDFTATRAVGVAAAGAVTVHLFTTTASGDPGGTTNFRPYNFSTTVSGANNFAGVRTFRNILTHSGSGTVTTMEHTNGVFTVSSTGNITTADIYRTQATLNSSGSVTILTHFAAETATLSSTGSIPTQIGFQSRNMGNATLVTTAIGHDAQNMTAAVTLTAGFRSQMNSGTGKWGFYATGTANNAFAGNVRIGSVVAPTVALDVTGAATISTTLIVGTTANPDANDGATLGISGTAWSDLFLASGAVIDFAAGNSVITHSSAVLTISTGDLRVTTAGTNTASVVTVGGTQTLTAKTLTSPTIITSPTAAGATWADLGTATTIDINGGTIDGTAIGGASAAAGKFTTVTTTGATFLHATTSALTDGAGVALGTLANAPTAGNPTKWIQIDDNGTTRKIPTWT